MNNSASGHKVARGYSRHTRGTEILFLLGMAVYVSPPSCAWVASPLFLNYRHSDTQIKSTQESAFQRGLVALKDGRVEAALNELTNAEQEQPSDARVRSFRGIALARLGRSSEAAAEYREAIRIDASMEDAYRNLGFLEWQERELAPALKDLQRAAALAPEDSYAHYYLGRVQLEAQTYDQGFRELTRSGVTWPADPDFLILASTGYIELGRTQEALRTIDKTQSLHLTDLQIVHVASLLLAVHENDRSIDVLKERMKTAKDHVPSWFQFDLAIAYLLAGRSKEAIGEARLCTDISFADVDILASAWSLMGIAEARMGSTDPAITALRQAAMTAPLKEEHWLNLTLELMTLGRYNDAISATEEGLATEPKSYALHLRLGAAHLAAGHYLQAEKQFRELVAAGDPLPTSYVGLAQVMLRMGRSDEAVSELEDARQRLGDNFLIDYFLGLAWDRTDTPSKAIALFEAAIRLNPESADAHFELGKTELVTGDARAAVLEFQKTLRIEPGKLPAQHLLLQAKHRAGEARPSATPEEVQSNEEENLLGDFILPEWKMPAGAMPKVD